MNYDDVAAHYFAPAAVAIPTPLVTVTPARRLRDALEPIATHGWWSRPPMERLAGLGLGFFDAYVWGRAAALGTPAPSVVVATFGVFEPGLLSAVLQSGMEKATRADVLAARANGASESLATIINPADAAAVADPLLAAIEQLDGMGRPLFSALRELPLPSSPAGRLWRAAELIREHRGDGHLAVGVAAGLDAVEMNVFTELWLGYPFGEYSGTRGWSAERLQQAHDSLTTRGWAHNHALTAEGTRARIDLENRTDDTQDALIAALGPGLDRLVAQAHELSERVIAAPAFPSDPRKRAAG